MGTTITKTALDNALRAKNVTAITDLLKTAGEDVVQVAGNVIAFPALDEAGNDAWVEVTIKVPKGSRLGKGEGFEGYDGYSLADFYTNEQAEKLAEAAKKKANTEARKATESAKKSKVKVEAVSTETTEATED